MASGLDPKLAAIFQEEAAEHLDELERMFLALDAGKAPSPGAQDECFRRAHTLKGAARAVGMQPVQDAAHELEDILNPYRGTDRSPPKEQVRDILGRLTALREMVKAGGGMRTAGGELREAETQYPESGAQDAALSTQSASPSTPHAARSTASLRIDAARLDRMITMLGNLTVSHKASATARAEAAGVTEVLAAAHREVERIEGHLRHNTVPARDAQAALDEVRLALRAARESLVTAALAADGRYRAEQILIEQLDGELRAARLLPFSTLALFLERAARDAAAQQNKNVRFTLDGGDVTLDRAVIEAVQEPLLHIVRNAVAHGIEPPAARSAAGKPEQAEVRVSALRSGNQVKIIVRDDGRGVDLDRLRLAAARAARASVEEIDALGRDALLDYVFHPRVTTAESADALAGRGAGLDIVRTRLRALQGDARVLATGPGGTAFELVAPVHLQVIRILVVRSGAGVYGIPTFAVRETVRVTPDSVRALEGIQALVRDSGPLPIAPLDTVLGVSARPASQGAGLVIESAGRPAALQVEEILDETEVLIRDLGYPLARVKHVAGACVQPDGSTLLILNPAELAESLVGGRGVPESAELETRPQILVVDDSPTTRSVLRGLFSSAGFDVTVATDGVEGSRAFQQKKFDVVVSDIQMPRLDGFGLTRAVKAASGGAVPVVLVTGRESDADRRAGLEAGADAYVVKSAFEEGGLLETVRRFL